MAAAAFQAAITESLGEKRDAVRTIFSMEHYERHLPHWNVIDRPLFVTFRLHGSLPKGRFFPVRSTCESGRTFALMDRLLDEGRTGPTFLAEPEIARILIAAIDFGATRASRYDLHSYVVMPNHVHMLVTPKVPTETWLGPLKGFTAHRANQILGRHGEKFWQEESYDHLVRSPESFERIKRYIELNPVKAGLARSREEYRWSSCFSVMAA